ncbi:MAG TPA: hypothetical protein VIO61_07470 [Anaerolineaceae bacterium]
MEEITFFTWLLIPLALILAAGIAAGLALFWKHSAQANLRTAMEQMRAHSASQRRLADGLRAYSETDPDIFVDRARGITRQVSELGREIQSAYQDYARLQQASRSAQAGGWRTWLAAPLNWLKLRRETLALLRHTNRIQSGLTQVGQDLNHLQHLGWDIALQARQAYQELKEINGLLAQMQVKNVCGKGYESACREEAEIQAALDVLPVYFLGGDEDTVLEQAGKEEIAEIHRVLAAHQPTITRLLSDSRLWSRQLEEALAGLAPVEQGLSDLRKTRGKMPATLSLGDIDNRILQMADQVHWFQTILAQPTVEQLPGVIKACLRFQQDALSVRQDLENTAQAYQDLVSALDTLASESQKLNQRMGELSMRTVHPLQWDLLQPQLIALQQQVNLLPPREAQRDPVQVRHDLRRASQMVKQLEMLTRQQQEVISAYHQVLALFKEFSPEALQDWQAHHETLARRVSRYHADNWERADGVGKFADDLAHLQEALRTVAPAATAMTIKESEVKDWLNGLQALVDDMRALDARARQIAGRLTAIQVEERRARDEAVNTRDALAQITAIAGGNPRLAEITTNELNRFVEQAAQNLKELDDPLMGTVERKAEKQRELANRLERASREWERQFNTAAAAETGLLQDKLDRLAEIALVDDPLVEQAIKLVESTDLGAKPAASKKTGGLAQPTTVSPMQSILEGLQQAALVYRQSHEMMSSLGEMESQVLEAHDRARRARERACADFTSASAVIPAERAWLPVERSLEAEKRRFRNLEEQWLGLPKKRIKPLALVNELAKLAEGYREAGEAARQAGEQAQKDKRRAEVLEDRYNQIRLQVQSPYSHDPSDIALAGAIEGILRRGEERLQEIKDQYLKGRQGYSQTIQALASLNQQMESACIQAGVQLELRDLSG